jgi:hypothetical protein
MMSHSSPFFILYHYHSASLKKGSNLKGNQKAHLKRGVKDRIGLQVENEAHVS